MAREHRADHRPVYPGSQLNAYLIAAIEDGPWPGRLALGPAPIGEHDPAAIAAWGANEVLGLTTPDEAERLGWDDISARLAAEGIGWLNLPLDDFTAPDRRFDAAWPPVRDRLLSRLNAGDRVLVHCRGGRGRSGTVLAALLVAAGLTPEAAIQTVRQARPGAIETADQVAWVKRLPTGTAVAPGFPG